MSTSSKTILLLIGLGFIMIGTYIEYKIQQRKDQIMIQMILLSLEQDRATQKK